MNNYTVVFMKKGTSITLTMAAPPTVIEDLVRVLREGDYLVKVTKKQDVEVEVE